MPSAGSCPAVKPDSSGRQRGRQDPQGPFASPTARPVVYSPRDRLRLVVPLLAAVPLVLLVAYLGLFALNLQADNAETSEAQADLDAELAAREATSSSVRGFPPRWPASPSYEDDPRLQAASSPRSQAEVDSEVASREEPPASTPLGKLWFERDGQPFLNEPLVFVQDVNAEQLALGPGRYPGTAFPGERGNVGIAGHRTTYGAPFGDLDQLQAGDTVVVRFEEKTFRYEVVKSEVVGPEDVWVIGEDPLETGEPTLTLTTCHPRYSAQQRLIVWSQLVESKA